MLIRSALISMPVYAFLVHVHVCAKQEFLTTRLKQCLDFRRVLGAGAVASTARAIIETPLEFAKVYRVTQVYIHVFLSSLLYAKTTV